MFVDGALESWRQALDLPLHRTLLQFCFQIYMCFRVFLFTGVRLQVSSFVGRPVFFCSSMIIPGWPTTRKPLYTASDCIFSILLIIHDTRTTQSVVPHAPRGGMRLRLTHTANDLIYHHSGKRVCVCEKVEPVWLRTYICR